ncbi:MAG: hypothetical protein KGQ78_09695 [Acidobacteria bacterium]|nr:hypothetical protein [Acidobacteriota bacterium]
MGLATYRSCTFTEKRAVLRTFWSQRTASSDKVVRAAQEYGPYAFVMVAVICAELILLAVALFAVGSVWAWLAVAATLLAGASTWWARRCQRAITRVATT